MIKAAAFKYGWCRERVEAGEGYLLTSQFAPEPARLGLRASTSDWLTSFFVRPTGQGSDESHLSCAFLFI